MFEQFEVIGKNIYRYQNFLSENESNKITLFLDSLNESDWYFDELPRDEKFKLAHNLDIIVLVREKLNQIIDSNYVLGENLSANRMISGDSWGVHADVYDSNEIFIQSLKYKNEEPYDEYNLPIFGTVIYFNDFDGGEIYYPKQNIEIKPKKGDLIIHGTEEFCAHGVKPVKSAKRYSYSNRISKLVKVPMGSI